MPPGEFEARIEDLAGDGRGVARVGGKVVFVAGALPGERARFRYLARGKDADEGQLTGLDSSSPDRVAPACAHFGVCGGCALQHLAPAAQLAFKQKQLLDTLARIGKVVPAEVAPAITGPSEGYRRRARLGVQYVSSKGGTLVGFRESGRPFLAALKRCPVLDPRVGERLVELGRLIDRLSIRMKIPQIEVAGADHMALVFRVLDTPNDADCEVLRGFAAEHGFELLLQPGGPDSIVALEPPEKVLDYSPDGGPDRLRFRPGDFIQINEAVSRQSVRQAIEWLAPQPSERVLELFCGLGNFSVPLARAGAAVTAVEGEAGLVRRARDNAKRLGWSIAFHQADLFQPRPDAAWLAGRFDALLLDPPRSGALEVLPLIARLAPARLLYVSCHPGTLARDAGLLVREYGYRLRRAGVMDMFPHTAHVESMALFERQP